MSDGTEAGTEQVISFGCCDTPQDLTDVGGLLYFHAVDHHAANDLVGAQDPAWDLVGAIVELGFSGEERARLLEAAARRGVRPTPEQLAFYEVTYLAFQMGWHLTAAQTLFDGRLPPRRPDLHQHRTRR